MSMQTKKQMYHTSCCGLDPFDYDNGYMGPQKSTGNGDWSPYPRINKLRKLYQSLNFTMDLSRLRIITEVYKANEAKSVVTKKAIFLKRFMEECELTYHEGELLLVDDGSPRFAMNVYPEQYSWVFTEARNDMLRTRNYLPYTYSDETRDELLTYEDYWKGKCIADTFRARLPETAAVGCALTNGQMIVNSNVEVDMGIGHTTPDFQRAFDMGIGGLKAYVREHKEKLGTPVTIEAIKAAELYDAQLMILDGMSTLFKRYAAYALELIDKYESQQTKDELKTLSEMCEHLAEGTPRSFWEAIQLHYAVCQMMFLEADHSALGMGRVDVLLYPYYKADMEKGILTKDFAQELIDYYYLRAEGTNTCQYPTNDLYRFGQRGSFGPQVNIGGQDAEGNDVTNDLSFMLLDGTAHTRQPHPFTSVRWHEKTPYELKIKVAETMRLGTGHPKIMNDKVAMEALERMGVDPADSWDYTNIGCVEMMPAGKSGGWLDIGGVNLPKILELALNNGRCLDCAGENCPNYTKCRGAGKSLGLQTGYLKDFKTFDEVKAAYEAQLKYWADRCILMFNVIQDSVREVDDYPLLSLFIDGCVESGKSWANGGAKYNHAGCQALGPATVADSLTALKKWVYDEKKYTAEEFYDAIAHNWEGHERLYQLVNSEKTPHYGNDDDYADAMMKYVFEGYCDLWQSYPPSCGIWKICTGSFSSIVNVLYGLYAGATPDGRKHHEVISANIEPARTCVTNRDKSGPTALARSIGKLDHCKCSTGTLINMKFGTDTVAGNEGRETLVDFLDSYFDQNPLHIQIMITDRETLIAAREHPEEYQDLIIRVSGFSAYFHSLSREFQDELINRTEHML